MIDQAAVLGGVFYKFPRAEDGAGSKDNKL
jgi:hypothetical protein